MYRPCPAGCHWAASQAAAQTPKDMIAEANVTRRRAVRACAQALGAIGPPAKSALPVLQAIAAKPILHVNGVIERSPSDAAERAIREI